MGYFGLLGNIIVLVVYPIIFSLGYTCIEGWNNGYEINGWHSTEKIVSMEYLITIPVITVVLIVQDYIPWYDFYGNEFRNITDTYSSMLNYVQFLVCNILNKHGCPSL